MLGDSDRELVAAAVDGELPDDREPLFRRLLAESANARELFHQLLSDRQTLQSLPHLFAPANTVDLVLRRIGRLPRVTPSGSGRGLGRWIGYTVAASVFLTAGGMAYWAATLVEDRSHPPDLVHKRPRRTQQTDPSVPDPVTLAERLPPPRPASNPSPAQAVIVQSTPGEHLERAPLPRAAGTGAVVGFGPQNGLSYIQEVDIRLPFLTALDGLDRPENRSRLLTELSGEPANRVDLFCTDLYKAGELFQAVAKKAGIHVAVDATSRELARNRLTAAFCVYSESLTPADAVALLDETARQVKSAGGSVIGPCHVYPAGTADHRELRELLGVDPGPWQRPKPAPGPRPLAAGTVDQLAAQLEKDRLQPGKTALMLTYLPVAGRTAPGLSKEVRTFLTHRGDRKPGTVPLFLVFRIVN